MPTKVKPKILLGLVIMLVLSFAISAGAQLAEESADQAFGFEESPVDPALDPALEQGAPLDPALEQGVPLDPAFGEVPAGDAFMAEDVTPVELVEPAGGGGTAGAALGAAEGQLGMPFALGTDGPDTFSCVGLMRHALRTAGVDADAPWVPEEYLSRYAPVAPGDLQPGDIVIYPGWATMYAGNGQLVNANEFEGIVTHTPMDVAGEPLGIVRPPYA